MADRLAGQVAIVTGAGRGIGRGHALLLAEEGASVIVNDYGGGAGGEADGQAGPADEVVAVIKDAGGNAAANYDSVSDMDAGERMVQQALDEFGRLDIVVNNAGLTRDGLALRMKDEDWRAVLEVNLTAAFRVARGALRGMMRRRWGRIINVTSVVGVAGNAGQANYAASKAGMIGMSKALAAEAAARGVTVNCIAPGMIDTDMTRALDEARRARMLAAIPAGRFGAAGDVAAGVVFLASEEAAYVTGQTLHVNGGMVMI